MSTLEAQVTLTGEKLEFEKDRVESWKDVFRGQYFSINVSEDQHDKLDRMHEKDQIWKIHDWIASHMKRIQNRTLPASKEGAAFQLDFELFCKIL